MTSRPTSARATDGEMPSLSAASVGDGAGVSSGSPRPALRGRSVPLRPGSTARARGWLAASAVRSWPAGRSRRRVSVARDGMRSVELRPPVAAGALDVLDAVDGSAGRPASRSRAPRLDESQTHALGAVFEQPVSLVLGAPGSGKTTLALEVAASAVEQHGTSPDKILVLGATRRGAGHLRDTLAARLGLTVRGAVVRTAPSAAFTILTARAQALGEPAPTLVTGPEQDLVLAELLAGHAAGEGTDVGWPTTFPEETLELRGFREEAPRPPHALGRAWPRARRPRDARPPARAPRVGCCGAPLRRIPLGDGTASADARLGGALRPGRDRRRGRAHPRDLAGRRQAALGPRRGRRLPGGHRGYGASVPRPGRRRSPPRAARGPRHLRAGLPRCDPGARRPGAGGLAAVEPVARPGARGRR